METIDVAAHTTKVAPNSRLIIGVNSVNIIADEVTVTIGRTGLPNVNAALNLGGLVLFYAGPSESYEIRLVAIWPLSNGASFSVTRLD